MVVDYRVVVHRLFEALDEGTHRWEVANVSVSSLRINDTATAVAISDKKRGIVLHEVQLEPPVPRNRAAGDYTLDPITRALYYKDISQYTAPSLPGSAARPQALALWRFRNLIVMTDYDAHIVAVVLVELNAPASE